MMQRKIRLPQVLIRCGGWDGHEPELIRQWFKAFLESQGFQVTVADALDVSADKERRMASAILLLKDFPENSRDLGIWYRSRRKLVW